MSVTIASFCVFFTVTVAVAYIAMAIDRVCRTRLSGETKRSKGMRSVNWVAVAGIVVLAGAAVLRNGFPTEIDAAQNESAAGASSISSAATKTTDEMVANSQRRNSPHSHLSHSLPPDAELSIEEVVRRTESSVALIQGSLGTGTGFVVDQHLVVTNFHVIERECVDDIQVRFPSHNAHSVAGCDVSVIYVNKPDDMAVLWLDATPQPLIISDEQEFRRGQEIVVIGSPGLNGGGALQNAICRGVTSMETTIDGRHLFQLGISINAGNSGGPVLDMQGRVIGVVTAKAIGREGIGFCVPTSKLAATVRAAQQQSEEQRQMVSSHHGFNVVASRLKLLATIYSVTAHGNALAMTLASRRGLRASDGVKAMQETVQVAMKKDRELMPRGHRHLDALFRNGKLPISEIRHLTALWHVYLDLKGLTERPRGSVSEYGVKVGALSEKLSQLKDR